MDTPNITPDLRSYFFFDVTDENGKKEKWSLDWTNRRVPSMARETEDGIIQVFNEGKIMSSSRLVFMTDLCMGRKLRITINSFSGLKINAEFRQNADLFYYDDWKLIKKVEMNHSTCFLDMNQVEYWKDKPYNLEASNQVDSIRTIPKFEELPKHAKQFWGTKEEYEAAESASDDEDTLAEKLNKEISKDIWDFRNDMKEQLNKLEKRISNLEHSEIQHH